MIRVLVVEDSSTMRAVITSRLGKAEGIRVVGVADRAELARELIASAKPDVITLDLELPNTRGFELLDEIMATTPTPVIVVSSTTSSGSKAAVDALARGAVGCYAKIDLFGFQGDADGDALAQAVREAAKIQLDKPVRFEGHSSAGRIDIPSFDKDLIAIGSSLGGIEALHQLLVGFPKNCPPTLIVQHINGNYVSALVQRLNKICPARVQMAVDASPLSNGNIYFAPGDGRHLRIRKNAGYRIHLSAATRPTDHCPSVDELFSSVAGAAGANAVGILLSGMGNDGAKGMLDMRQAGAQTIVQDRSTSLVFGMPGAAIDLGAAQSVLPLDRILENAVGRARH